jgi:uncharacterized membrane protein YbhN (UPF0104 family)
LLIAAFVAAWFTAALNPEQGDYPQITAIILIAALWPVAAGAGVGIGAGQAYRFIRRAFVRLSA